MEKGGASNGGVSKCGNTGKRKRLDGIPRAEGWI
jgi:hypothetical protein